MEKEGLKGNLLFEKLYRRQHRVQPNWITVHACRVAPPFRRGHNAFPAFSLPAAVHHHEGHASSSPPFPPPFAQTPPQTAIANHHSGAHKNLPFAREVRPRVSCKRGRKRFFCFSCRTIPESFVYPLDYQPSTWS